MSNLPGRTSVIEEPETSDAPGALGSQLDLHQIREASERPLLEALEEAEETPTWWERYHLWIATIGCWLFTIAGVIGLQLLGAPKNLTNGLFIVAYLSRHPLGGIGAAIARQTRGQYRPADVLAALGAAAVDHWEEGAILFGLFSLSNALEHYALGRTRAPSAP